MTATAKVKYGTKTPERKTTGAYRPMDNDARMLYSSQGRTEKLPPAHTPTKNHPELPGNTTKG
jgi:hypothetical protein